MGLIGMTVKSHQKERKSEVEKISSAGFVLNMFKVDVMFELDTDFTLAQQSLPNYQTVKIKISHDWGGNKYMVCQVILTQEMTKQDLIDLVTGIRTWMDGVPPMTEAESKERKQLCQKSKKLHNEKTTPMLESKDVSS